MSVALGGYDIHHMKCTHCGHEWDVEIDRGKKFSQFEIKECPKCKKFPYDYFEVVMNQVFAPDPKITIEGEDNSN